MSKMRHQHKNRQVRAASAIAEADAEERYALKRTRHELRRAKQRVDDKVSVRILDAKYAGTCDACGERFSAGTTIMWEKNLLRGEGSYTRHLKCG